ncbi:MAG TPA: sigma 54-interacting transcriptional regulator [Dissulfurispiraceae bacterium]|nr:sigma 54-interacting transcriptional regulator [Dissulfurispiraceae bacterium]
MQRSVRMQSLVDTHDEPFVVIDANQCILAVNRAFEEAFRFSREEITGRKCHEMLTEDGFPCHEKNSAECPYHSVFQRQEPGTCRHTYYDESEGLIHVTMKSFPLFDDESTLYMGMSINKFASERGSGCEGKTGLAGRSPAFLSFLEKIERAAQSDSPVLLTGETGTGKELAASYIHEKSGRCRQPFITIDCTVLTESLFESEVFGYERGAFTGSFGTKTGLIELADGGTLFLDEISEIPLTMQSKLLRVIEKGEFRKLAGKKTRKADIRVICATNRDLLKSIDEGHFRKDLYYRIAVFSVPLPPLRDRIDDVPVIAEEVLRKIGDERGLPFTLTDDALRELMAYPYPGNVRELRNILHLAASYSTDGRLTPAEILRYPGFAKASAQERREESIDEEHHPSGKSMDSVEANFIGETLRKSGGNRRQAAKTLGISERTLYRKMKRFGLR